MHEHLREQVAKRKIKPRDAIRQRVGAKHARTDIVNVVEILKPTQEVLDALKPPDVHRIINKGLGDLK